jgi:hypothetical protein
LRNGSANGASGVLRYELPNLQALNFVLRRALDGGGLVSLRLDTQGKTYGFALLRMEVEVPDDLAFERLVQLIPA